ncbi:MAG: DegT/DnrJ/EryC1/StrS family aminotransferase, partial [Bacteroidales bacterium]
SIFPSKSLGCYGDGGALITESDERAAKIRTIAYHGSNKQYHHVVLGVNSRLDTIQAVVLKVKLKYLNDYIQSRQSVAQQYTEAFKGINAIVTPTVRSKGTHVFHQYTIRVKNGMRDDLKAHLASNGIASMIYYPIPLHRQEAYAKYWNNQTDVSLNNSIQLASEVLSLPIHTEMTEETIKYITSTVQHFFQN